MSDKLDFLAFGAHPDDVELGCGATIAKLVSQGKKVGIVDLTRGELGTRGSAEIRTKETNEASKILGITIRENMDFKDGFFRNDEEHQLKIIQVLENINLILFFVMLQMIDILIIPRAHNLLLKHLF